MNPPSRVLQALEKPLSPAERPGAVYTFRILDDRGEFCLFKVGRTSRDWRKRQAEWANCDEHEQVWFEDPVYVSSCHRVESVVHKALEEMGYQRIREPCKKCQRVHVEIFAIPNPNAWEEVIKPLIEEIGMEVQSRM
ncbi:hypothetical protein VNI00_016761 [Paramarasmius palmivorus]|uniref:Bacteriophage T5 Orf172 DNA-binding domain-containing protein n=1 Tax=Paramarasmius palmivorus TaxID=297713 RepID=A0AAW0BC16_9AGAR